MGLFLLTQKLTNGHKDKRKPLSTTHILKRAIKHTPLELPSIGRTGSAIQTDSITPKQPIFAKERIKKNPWKQVIIGVGQRVVVFTFYYRKSASQGDQLCAL